MVTVQKKCCKHSNWYITFNEALLGTDYIMITKPARHLISVIVRLSQNYKSYNYLHTKKIKNIKFKIIESLMTICIECFDYWEDI